MAMDAMDQAPEQFHVSAGLEEELGAMRDLTGTPNDDDMSLTLQCLLCTAHKTDFYCETCIRNGCLKHSTAASLYDDDYSKKVSDLVKLQDAIQLLNTSCQQRLQKSIQFQEIKQQIDKKRLKVEYLRAIVEQKKGEVDRKKVVAKELMQKNNLLKCTLPKYDGKVREMEDYVLNKKNHLGRKLTERSILERNVRIVARQCVKKLIKYIFPIERVSTTDSLTNKPGCPSTAKELSEATRTAYIEGHWILQDSGGTSGAILVPSPTSTVPTTTAASSSTKPDVQYIIVAPSLPSSGNYLAYNEWFIKNRDTLPNPTADKDVRINQNPACRILAGLTYTAQLIQVLRFYLDVRFPFSISAADFCLGFLSDSKFQRRVTRLNANIVHLLYTQGVKLNDIQPTHSLKNIMLLLEVIERGDDRINRYVDPSNVNFNLIDDHFSPILLTDSCTDTDETDEENSLQTDWEALDIVQPMHPNLAGLVGPGAPPQLNPLQTASMTMTSAAATIASIFRGFTGR